MMKKHYLAVIFGAGGAGSFVHKKSDSKQELELWAKEQLRAGKYPVVTLYECIGAIQTKMDIEEISVE